MEVKIPKELREYSENVYFGLNLRQFIFAGLACVTAVILYFIFIQIVNMEITSWICIIGTIPFVALGFIRIHGLPMEKYARYFINNRLLMPRYLTFKSTNLYVSELREYEKGVKHEKNKHIRKKDKRQLQNT